MRIAPGLEDLLVPVDSLTPWPGNAKLHDLGEIRQSIERYGYTDPVVVQKSSMRIMVGNGRHEAVVSLGEPMIPAVIHDLTDAQALYFVLKHNRSQEKGGGYDDEALADLLREAKEYAGDDDLAELTGWADHDLAALEQALAGSDRNLDDVIRDMGEPGDDDLWPTLEFKVPPPARAAFFQYTADAADDTDAGRFLHLLKVAGWSPEEAL
ncbi:ParB N-terminal domain-containing protein [Streptomyces sp. NPDC049879]|uniref:ParB N-terminal domain-containing protein n=1 Tax=Streptomyces sp. NPDC049879 TaxID=3365598 RepID=UPI0037AFBFB3